MAQTKNAIPLPIVPKKIGVALPPEKDCITNKNYQLKDTFGANDHFGNEMDLTLDNVSEAPEVPHCTTKKDSQLNINIFSNK